MENNSKLLQKDIKDEKNTLSSKVDTLTFQKFFEDKFLSDCLIINNQTKKEYK